MKNGLHIALISAILLLETSCNPIPKNESKSIVKYSMTAKEILGNPKYQAISYGGYRQNNRDIQPTVGQLKEDLKILYVMGIRILRTYNVQLAHASNVLKAIHELNKEQQDFEMYVMLGAWIDCKNAWTDLPVDHNIESEQNKDEIGRAVTLANQYPEIVKIIAVGNEAMVKWATAYYVQPSVILKWVKHLQGLKADGQLSKDLWITSSDDFASWGGGDSEYHTKDLNELIGAVDYISMHTYPMHNTHYNPEFWGTLEEEKSLTKEKKMEQVMFRSLDFSKSHYNSVKNYVNNTGWNKPIHIGETGWATASNGHYGTEGSGATDEFKEGLYYQYIRNWTNQDKISCFYFEAFDEQWKDANNPGGSENFFGLFTVDGKAKYAIWPFVDLGAFDGLTRAGKPITKTSNGSKEKVLEEALMPPLKNELKPAH